MKIFKTIESSIVIFPFLLSLHWIVDCAEEENGYEVVRVNAMGRVARLGELFNYAKDQFTQISILNKDLPKYLTRRIGTPTTNAKYDVYSSFSEKASLFAFSGDFKVSASVGIIGGSLSAAGSFLTEKKNSRKEASGAVVYETLTDTDFLEIFYDEMRDHISKPILTESPDSHVVVAIGYGANVIFEYSEKESSKSSRIEIGASLRASLDAMFSTALLGQLFPGGVPTLPGFTGFNFGGAVGASINASLALKEEFKGKSVKVWGDVNFCGVNFPTDVMGVLYTISRIPFMVNCSNDGRGKQLYFYLMPIERVRKFMNMSTNSTTYKKPVPLPPDTSDECLQALETLDIVEAKVTELYSIIMTNRVYMNNTETARVGKLRSMFNAIAAEFRARLKKGIVAVRSGETEAVAGERSDQSLRNIIKNFTTDKNSLEMIETIIDNDFREVRLKLEMVDYLEKSGNVSWVGRGDSVFAHLFKLFNTKPEVEDTCYIHFYSWYLQSYAVYFALFVQEVAKKTHVFIVDCEFEHASCVDVMNREIHCHPFQKNPNPYYAIEVPTLPANATSPKPTKPPKPTPAAG